MESTTDFSDLIKVEQISWCILTLPMFNAGGLLCWAVIVLLQFGFLPSFNDMDLKAAGPAVLTNGVVFSMLLLPVVFIALPLAIFCLVIAGIKRKALKTILPRLGIVFLLDAFYYWLIFADPLGLSILH